MSALLEVPQEHDLQQRPHLHSLVSWLIDSLGDSSIGGFDEGVRRYVNHHKECRKEGRKDGWIGHDVAAANHKVQKHKAQSTKSKGRRT